MATYDATTALLVIDVQNDFADPAGALSVRGGEAVIPVINEEIRKATEAGALVAYSQDWHPEETPHFRSSGGIWPEHCVAGTWGAELHPELTVVDDAVLIRKGKEGEDGYSAFSVRDPLSGETTSTELGRILEQRGIERVVVVGLATDYCVKETALDALRRELPTTVLSPAVAAVNLQPDDGEAALLEVQAAGATIE
jgi:nicotinamidase/pyrazinamidase